MEQRTFFGLPKHLDRLSAHGDPLEVLAEAVDLEAFRPVLLAVLGYGDGAKSGRPQFDPVAMFKALILQTQHKLSDAKMEFFIRNRLPWMRFLGFGPGDRTPDENTIRLCRSRLAESGALKRVMAAFDEQLHRQGDIPMFGQIIGASLALASKQRNSEGEKEAVKAGKAARQIWPTSRTRRPRRTSMRAGC